MSFYQREICRSCISNRKNTVANSENFDKSVDNETSEIDKMKVQNFQGRLLETENDLNPSVKRRITIRSPVVAIV